MTGDFSGYQEETNKTIFEKGLGEREKELGNSRSVNFI